MKVTRINVICFLFLTLLMMVSSGLAVTDNYYVDNITAEYYLNDTSVIPVQSTAYTGTWDDAPELMLDGNYSTYARGDNTGVYYINYTLASTATSATAHYKVSAGNASTVLPSACVQSPLQLKVESHTAFATNSGYLNCWNGTAWYRFTGQVNALIYEVDVSANAVSPADSIGSNHGALYGKTFYHGTNNGATSVDQTGSMEKYGLAYSFDGVNDYLQLDSSINSNTYTITFFAKKNSISPLFYPILGHTSGTVSYIGFTSNRLEFESDISADQCRGTLNEDDTDWHQYTVLLAGTTCYFYQDGIAMTMTDNTYSGNLTISRIGKTTSFYHNGSIDEVKIFTDVFNSVEREAERFAVGVANPEGIVAYYSFNDDVGTTVLDTNHLSPGPRQEADPSNPVFKWDKGMNFDGVDDYVQASFNPGYNKTYCMWFNPSEIDNNILFTLRSGSSYPYVYYRSDNKDILVRTASATFRYCDANLVPNQYYHFCTYLAYNVEDIKSYLNGVDCTAPTYANSDVPATTNTFIIGQIGTNANYMNGSIADVRIFDRAITDDEVYALYVGTDALTTIEVSPYIYNKPNAKVLIDGEYYTNYIDIDSQFTEIQTKAGNYSISLMDGSEVLATYEVTLNSVFNSVNLTDSDLNYVRFLNEGSPLATKNVRVAYPSGDLINLVTDSSGYVNFTSYYDDEVQYGNYSITYLNDPGYVTPITFTYEAVALPFNVTYNLTRTTVNINIYDRLTGNAFTENASIIFQGVNNVSTSTGNYTFDAVSIVSGNYTILVKSDGYFTEQKLFTFDNQVAVNLSYYLMKNNASTAVTVTIQVLDTTQTKIENAEVNMLEYDLTTLSYISVSQGYTNSEGKVVFLAELNDKTYKFTARKVLNGFLRSGDSGDGGLIFRDEIVAGSPITFEQQTVNILLTGFEVFEFNPSLYLNYDITENFNDTTNISTISVDFRTTDGSDATVCIEFYSVSGSTKTSELQICDTGNAGTITPDIPFVLNRTKSYQLEVYTLVDTTMMPLQTFRYQSSTSFQEVLRIYAILKPAVLFFWIAIISVAMYSGNLVLGGVLGIILSIIEFILFPNVLTASGGILKIIVCIQVIYFGRKKEDYA